MQPVAPGLGHFKTKMNKNNSRTVSDQQNLPPAAFLIGIQGQGDSSARAAELLAELSELVATLGLPVVGSQIAKIRLPNPALIVGSGRAEELAQEAAALSAEVIILDDFLTPAQQRNWEKITSLPVIDRQEIILDIFAARAHTSEAVLQVELAKAVYALPRLKRLWTHLHRQRGMAGGLGGRAEGEQQLELDSRLVRKRIARLKEQLSEVRQQRDVQRSRRLRKPVPVAAIVGYTNAGKSSLLNALTQASVYTEDKLFATLDPTVRRLILPGGLKLLLGDTVGFIRKLPHLLVEAFKSTLEETKLADFIIEVLDASSESLDEHHQATLQVLQDIGITRPPLIMVLNKCDLLTTTLQRQRLQRAYPEALLVSAQTGEGLPELLQELSLQVSAGMQPLNLLIPHNRYDLMNVIRKNCALGSEQYTAEGVILELRAPPSCYALLSAFAIPEASQAALPSAMV